MKIIFDKYHKTILLTYDNIIDAKIELEKQKQRNRYAEVTNIE